MRYAVGVIGRCSSILIAGERDLLAAFSDAG
jgi:hypothetical protein